MRGKEDIEPKNDKCEWHGYQEWYYHDDTIMHRCKYKNGKQIGYYEYHHRNHHESQSNTSFYIR